MLKVVPLPEPPPPNPEIIGVLREMLTRAEAGELASVFISASLHNGEVLRMRCMLAQRLALLAGITIAQQQLARELGDAAIDLPDAG